MTTACPHGSCEPLIHLSGSLLQYYKINQSLLKQAQVAYLSAKMYDSSFNLGYGLTMNNNIMVPTDVEIHRQ